MSDVKIKDVLARVITLLEFDEKDLVVWHQEKDKIIKEIKALIKCRNVYDLNTKHLKFNDVLKSLDYLTKPPIDNDHEEQKIYAMEQVFNLLNGG